MSVAWLSALLSALHVLGIALGLGALYARARAAGRGDLATTLSADNWWGLSALLVIPTGLIRAFGPVEKGSAYYLAHDLFVVKLAMVGLLLCLELPVMITLVRWRVQQARGREVDAGRLGVFGLISRAQLLLLLLIPFVAAMVARGLGHSALGGLLGA